MNSTTIIFLLTLITVVFIAWGLYLAFENDKLEKQSKTDSGIIAKNIMRIINQGIDIELLKDQLKHEKHNKEACNACKTERIQDIRMLHNSNDYIIEEYNNKVDQINQQKEVIRQLFKENKRLSARIQKRDKNGRFISKTKKQTA